METYYEFKLIKEKSLKDLVEKMNTASKDEGYKPTKIIDPFVEEHFGGTLGGSNFVFSAIMERKTEKEQ